MFGRRSRSSYSKYVKFVSTDSKVSATDGGQFVLKIPKSSLMGHYRNRRNWTAYTVGDSRRDGHVCYYNVSTGIVEYLTLAKVKMSRRRVRPGAVGARLIKLNHATLLSPAVIQYYYNVDNNV